MSLTADALWLNTVFAGYDMAILSFMHKLAESAGAVLTPLFKLITLLGEKGILFFLLGIVLMLFPRWRRTGLCIFGAVCCGALITNILLKDVIARPRPFEASDLFRQWWQAVGSPAEDGFSFPSGHVTAAAAGVTGLCLMRGRRWVLPGCIWVLLMMVARNYLMAHYPSDGLNSKALAAKKPEIPPPSKAPTVRHTAVQGLHPDIRPQPMLHPAMPKSLIRAIRESTDSFPSRVYDCPGFLHEKTGADSFKLFMI